MKGGEEYRGLKFVDCCSIMVGIIIGAGIYETSPPIAASLPNPFWLFTLWLTGGVCSLAGALCYSELATRFPQQGGELLYLSKAFTPKLGFLFAWGRTAIAQPGGIAAMAYTFSRSIGASSPSLVACIAVVVLTGVNLRMRSERVMQNGLSLVKVLGLLMIISCGVFLAPPHPIVPVERPLTLDGIGLALILILFCYGGWNELAFVANDVEHPERNITRSLLVSVSAVILLYSLITFSYLRALGYEGLSTTGNAAADTLAAVFPNYASQSVRMLVAISALGAANGMIFTGARLSSAMGRDYPSLSALSRTIRGAPVVALVVQATVTCAIVLLAGSFQDTVLYTSTVVWLFFTLTGVAYFRLRDSKGTTHFKAPLYPWTGIVFIASSAFVTYRSLVYDLTGTVVACIIVLAGLPFSRSTEK